MRSPEEMQSLILKIANEDERIRAVTLGGSRANSDCPADIYQDFDIVFYVKDVDPFWDNMPWIKKNFGSPLLIQKPESMKLIAPDNNGNFVYLMLFPDGNRIDLCITAHSYESNGEPVILLLDKDGSFPEIKIRKDYWYVQKPDSKLFRDCCNEFHWCLNNVAKGIAREELSYAMEQLNHYVRDMLLLMLDWFIGAQHDFKISTGKNGKYYKKLLPTALYDRFCKSYSDAKFSNIWNAAFEALALFGSAARTVAAELHFAYDEAEEHGIEQYMKAVRAAL